MATYDVKNKKHFKIRTLENIEVSSFIGKTTKNKFNTKSIEDSTISKIVPKSDNFDTITETLNNFKLDLQGNIGTYFRNIFT